jgi:hypothetical protein
MAISNCIADTGMNQCLPLILFVSQTPEAAHPKILSDGSGAGDGILTCHGRTYVRTYVRKLK